jgi:hypothetical protein
MATGVPGEAIKLRQVQLIHEVGDTSRMLMAAMEQHDCLARPGGLRGRPVPVEKLDAVVGTEGVLLLFAHRKNPYAIGEVSCCSLRP